MHTAQGQRQSLERFCTFILQESQNKDIVHAELYVESNRTETSGLYMRI
jgi:hypothetical protein